MKKAAKKAHSRYSRQHISRTSKKSWIIRYRWTVIGVMSLAVVLLGGFNYAQSQQVNVLGAKSQVPTYCVSVDPHITPISGNGCGGTTSINGQVSVVSGLVFTSPVKSCFGGYYCVPKPSLKLPSPTIVLSPCQQAGGICVYGGQGQLPSNVVMIYTPKYDSSCKKPTGSAEHSYTLQGKCYVKKSVNQATTGNIKAHIQQNTQAQKHFIFW